MSRDIDKEEISSEVQETINNNNNESNKVESEKDTSKKTVSPLKRVASDENSAHNSPTKTVKLEQDPLQSTSSGSSASTPLSHTASSSASHNFVTDPWNPRYDPNW